MWYTCHQRGMFIGHMPCVYVLNWWALFEKKKDIFGRSLYLKLYGSSFSCKEICSLLFYTIGSLYGSGFFGMYTSFGIDTEGVSMFLFSMSEILCAGFVG